MKITFTSRVLDLLGRVVLGSPSALLGLKPGAFADMYSLPTDRPPLDRTETTKPAWLIRRVAEINIRRRLTLRVAVLASILAVCVVIAGLAMIGMANGLRAATTEIGLHATNN